MLKLKKNLNPKPKRSNLLRLAKGCVLAFVTTFALAEALKIELKPGTQDFSFSLPANASTGYHWSLVSFDASLLKLKSARYHAKTSKLIGSGGVMTYNFTVIKPKQDLHTQIVLKYARPWEPKPVQTQTVDVSASKSFFSFFKW